MNVEKIHVWPADSPGAEDVKELAGDTEDEHAQGGKHWEKAVLGGVEKCRVIEVKQIQNYWNIEVKKQKKIST